MASFAGNSNSRTHTIRYRTKIFRPYLAGLPSTHINKEILEVLF